MNTQNIINLIKRYFIESDRKDITTFVSVLLIIAFVGVFQPMGRVSDSLMWLILYIMSIVFAGRVFGIFQPANRAIHYLTIPASSAEKTLVNACLVYLYYNILLITALFLGGILSELVRKIIVSSYELQLYFPFDWNDLCFLLILESIFMFGSIYFKTHAVSKTLLSLLVIVIFFVILDTTILGFYMQSFTSGSFHRVQNSLEKDNFDLLEYAVSILVFLFFNFMTWLRLRETEA